MFDDPLRDALQDDTQGNGLKKLPSCLPRAAARERRLSAPCYHTLLWHDTFSTIPSIICGTDTSTLCSTVRVRVCGTIFTHSSNSFKILRQRIRLRAVMRRSCQDHGAPTLPLKWSSLNPSCSWEGFWRCGANRCCCCCVMWCVVAVVVVAAVAAAVVVVVVVVAVVVAVAAVEAYDHQDKAFPLRLPCGVRVPQHLCFRCGLLGGVGGHGRLRSAVHSPECESGVHTECSVLSFILVKDAFLSSAANFPHFPTWKGPRILRSKEHTVVARRSNARKCWS